MVDFLRYLSSSQVQLLGLFLSAFILLHPTCAIDGDQLHHETSSSLQKEDYLASFQKTLQKLEQRVDLIQDENIRLKESVSQLRETTTALQQEVRILRAATKADTPYTCQDLQDAGIGVSGVYEIDPDGANVGEEPISVYCDFTGSSAVTILSHDIVGTTVEIDHCQEPGCHVTDVTYPAPLKQIQALMGMSGECSQSIRYDCYATPLVDNGNINMAWWTGPAGNPNYYWDGNHSSSIHTCACGADESCANPNYVCNCDSGAPLWLNDTGMLTNSEELPVVQLSFGGFFFDQQEAKFELGPLQCNGRKAFDATESCYTLRLSGHTRSGYYIIDGPNGRNYEVVRCNMDLEFSNAAFQVATPFKIPEFPVAFDFKRSSYYSSSDGYIIPFETYLVNHGEAMTMDGTFTAPLDGIYQFVYSYDRYDSYTEVELRIDGTAVATTASDGTDSLIVPLHVGQEVNLYLMEGRISDSADMHFSGHLLYPFTASTY